MAGQVFKNAYLSVNAVDLSDHVQQVALTYKADAVDGTAMGDSTHIRLTGSLKDWSISADFFQDYAAGKVDDTLNGIVGTVVAIEFRPDAGAVSATNPSYTGQAFIESYEPGAGNVGQALMAKVSIQAAGDLTRATA